MNQPANIPPMAEGGDLPVSLRSLMHQLGQAARDGARPAGERFFDALRAICLTIDPSLLWRGADLGVAGFLAAISSIEDRVRDGSLDDNACLDALMSVLAVNGYLSPGARPVLTDRLARTLASYRSEFAHQDVCPADAALEQDVGQNVGQDVMVDWNALGVRLMHPASDMDRADDAGDDAGWEDFPAVQPSGPTLH